MSLYKGNNLISGAMPNSANQSLSNLNSAGQDKFDAKVDLDLTNVNNVGYIKMAGAGMPSSTYTNLTLGASGSTYTAPANGWFIFSKRGTATGQWMTADCGAQRQCYISSTNQAEATIYMAVKKGDVLKLTYSLGGENVFSRFVYAQGSESEAL